MKLFDLLQIWMIGRRSLLQEVANSLRPKMQ